MNSQVHTHTHAPRWALMLLALGLAVVVLGGGYLLWRVYRDADTGARS